MRWIDDAERALAAMRKRDHAVRKHAEPLYEELWSEVARNLAEARSKVGNFAGLLVGGRQGAIIIALGDRQLSIRLNTNDRCIDIASEFADHWFRLRVGIDLCGDGVTRLHIENEKVSFSDATVRILRPFLFPELY